MVASIPSRIEQGCGWNRGEVGIDGFGSFGDGWLERRGSRRILRGDLVGSAAAGEGTKSLDFRVRTIYIVGGRYEWHLDHRIAIG